MLKVKRDRKLHISEKIFVNNLFDKGLVSRIKNS